MRLRELYSYYLANWISRGSLVHRENMSDLGIRAVYSKILTKRYVTKAWIIHSIPVDFEYNLSDVVRMQMFESHPKARTLINTHGSPIVPAIERDIFKSQFSNAEEKYTEAEKLSDSMTPSQKHGGIKMGRGMVLKLRPRDIKRLRDRWMSYDYVAKHTLGGGRFFKTNIFIQASGPDSEYMDRYRDSLANLLSDNKIEFEEITGTTSHYLNNYGPASYLQEESKKYSKNLMSDENMSLILPTSTRGLVGGKGTLFGKDCLSHLPLVLDVFKTSKAQVILIVGKAGEGKTMVAEFLSISFASQNVHVSVIDYKGGEYKTLDMAFDPLIVDIGGNDAPIVNTMRLDDVPVDEEDCVYIFNLAISATVELFSTIISLSPTSPDGPDIETVFTAAVKKAYSMNAEFNENNPDTFKSTKNMKYETVVDIVDEMSKAETYKTISGILEKSVMRLREYFRTVGKYGTESAREITLADVISHKMVIYELNKNSDSTMTVKDSVRIFMVQHLSRKKHFVRSKQHLFTLEIYEEMTRVEEASTHSDVNANGKRLLLFISQVVTGARSDNVLVLLLANNLNSFKTASMRPIRSNITSVIAGKMIEDDIKELTTSFGCQGIEDYVRAISSDDSKFRNSFGIKFDNGDKVYQTMFKVVLPEYVLEGLRQRDVVDI